MKSLSVTLLTWMCCWTVVGAQAEPRTSPAAVSFDPQLADVPLLGVLQLHSLLQTRYVATFAERSHNPRVGYPVREDKLVHEGDGFDLHRLYLRLNASPAPWLSSKVVLNFAKFETGGVKGVVRQAYAKLSPLPGRLAFSAGVLQLPYSLMKLTSASRLEVADKGPSAERATELDFAGRDLGVSAQVSPLKKKKRLRISVGAYRGHAKDEHASPLGFLAGRLTVRPFKGLELGASASRHMFDAAYKQPLETSSKEILPMPRDPRYPYEKSWGKGSAWGVDATFEHAQRLLVRAEGMWGDRVDVDERYGARAFFGAFALVAYRFQVGPIALQPVLRGEWSDAGLDHDLGTRRVYTFAMHVIINQHVRVLLDATHTDVDDATPVIDSPRPLPAWPYFDLDHTRAIGQLQVEI